MERTLIILKPDAVQRGIVGEIITRFEKAGFKIVGAKMVHPDRDHYYDHYEGISKLTTRLGKELFEATLEMMQQGPVVAIVLEGIAAVEQVRKMVGSLAPGDSPPGTIRGDFAHVSKQHSNSHGGAIINVIHASGDVEEAKSEISHWFSESELFDYQSVHEHYTQAKGAARKK